MSARYLVADRYRIEPIRPERARSQWPSLARTRPATIPSRDPISCGPPAESQGTPYVQRDFCKTEAFRTSCFQLAVAIAAIAMTAATVRLYWNLGHVAFNLENLQDLLVGSLISVILIRNFIGELGRFNPIKTFLLSRRGAMGEATVLKIQRFQEDGTAGFMLNQYEIIYRFEDTAGKRRVDCVCTFPVPSQMRLKIRTGDTLPVLYLKEFPEWSSLLNFSGLLTDSTPPGLFLPIAGQDSFLATYAAEWSSASI